MQCERCGRVGRAAWCSRGQPAAWEHPACGSSLCKRAAREQRKQAACVQGGLHWAQPALLLRRWRLAPPGSRRASGHRTPTLLLCGFACLPAFSQAIPHPTQTMQLEVEVVAGAVAEAVAEAVQEAVQEAVHDAVQQAIEENVQARAETGWLPRWPCRICMQAWARVCACGLRTRRTTLLLCRGGGWHAAGAAALLP